MHERPFVGRRQEAARRDEEGPAAHGRVEDSERQDRLGCRVARERLERLPDDVVRHLPRRVERARRLASQTRADQAYAARLCRQPARHRSSVDHRFVIEHAFVHRPQLLDAQVAEGDALAPRRGGRGRDRHHRPGREVIIHAGNLEEGRAARGEQAAVERRDDQVARAAAVVGQARDGLDRRPQPAMRSGALGLATQRLDGVAALIDGMPRRHQAARLGEEQEEQAVDDRERQLEGLGRGNSRPRAECADQQLERLADAVAQGTTDSQTVALGSLHNLARDRRACVGSRHGPAHLERRGVLDRVLESDVEIRARPTPPEIPEPEADAVEAEGPPGTEEICAGPSCGGVRHPTVQTAAPQRDDDGNFRIRSVNANHDGVAVGHGRRARGRVAQHVEQWCRAVGDDLPEAGRWAQRRAFAAPPGGDRPMSRVACGFAKLTGEVPPQAAGREAVRHERSADAWQRHWSPFAPRSERPDHHESEARRSRHDALDVRCCRRRFRARRDVAALGATVEEAALDRRRVRHRARPD